MYIPFGTVINQVSDISNFIKAKNYEIKESGFGLINGLKMVYVEINSLIGYSSINSKEYTVMLKPLNEGFEVVSISRTF